MQKPKKKNTATKTIPITFIRQHKTMQNLDTCPRGRQHNFRNITFYVIRRKKNNCTKLKNSIQNSSALYTKVMAEGYMTSGTTGIGNFK